MFIYSIRASTIRFFSIIIFTLAILFGIVLFGDTGALSVSASSDSINFSGMKTNDDRIAFIVSKFRTYIKGYHTYVSGKANEYQAKKYRYTTLKYFHDELGLTE